MFVMQYSKFFVQLLMGKRRLLKENDFKAYNLKQLKVNVCYKLHSFRHNLVCFI